MTYEYTSLVTIVAIILVFVFMFKVAVGRVKYNVSPPKMSGHATWDRLFRIHANTVEQAVVFFPALWLAAVNAGDLLAAGIGSIWLIGRVIYSGSYVKNPESRAPGMFMTFGSTAILAGISLFYIVLRLLG